jgi:YidC/Oxa1 family membrane protein insertase
MQQQSQTKNIILFVVLMLLCFGVWYVLRTYVFPPPPEAAPPAALQAAETVGLGAGEGGLAQGLGQAAVLAAAEGKKAEPTTEAPKPVAPPVAVNAPPAAPPTPVDKLKVLGKNDRNSPFHLYVELDPRGASVRRVVLNKFQQADALGRPVTKPDGSPEPLTLVPDHPENPSNLLLHFDVNNKDDDKPFDTLGKVLWTVEESNGPEAAGSDAEPKSYTFVSPPVQGFQVTKIYSLAPGEYHLGLEVKVKRLKTPTLDDHALAFRYQMTGFHGLPVEGLWYTNTFRTSLIGQVKTDDAKAVERDYQDLRQISTGEGGKPVDRGQGYLIRYAGVAVQYFASVVVVDDQQAEGQKQDFLVHARPTLERTVVKGVIKHVTRTKDDEIKFDLARSDTDLTQTFRIRKEDESKFTRLEDEEGKEAAVVYTTDSYSGSSYPEYARELITNSNAKGTQPLWQGSSVGATQPLWENDVTVRVATEPVELKAGEEFTHKYLLYNGPVKVLLLGQPDAPAEAVAPELVNRYLYTLNLNTLTDHPSPSWIGNITGPIGISYVLIQITNVMHSVLWFLHAKLYIPYILCIVCLTVMVRGVMFPISRKQAMTSLRMQQLAPELKKLQEKFKDDKQGLAAAQMEMYRKHGVNPFGTCWLLLLQMPIFMGLYYSLQESIHFRLAGVSSWWMPNLSAPDMLLNWNYFFPLPFIGDPAWYGWIWYLGPYLNVLPILAVSLMLVQQKWTMPPPTDEQQEQQQKIMKWMMVVMGVMFYKVASGLCIYFIASSLWGFMERRFLPKKKPVPGAAPAEEKPGVLSRLLGPKPDNGASAAAPSGRADAQPRGRGKRAKRRQEARTRAKNDGDGSMLQRLRDWWEDILEQARKK